jgi:hypothetical protein
MVQTTLTQTMEVLEMLVELAAQEVHLQVAVAAVQVAE